MFKFMKSKKGFSLVELMIVVVIMAILVAVAVPIYNSVTDNARKGTCTDNQRQIMSIIGNDLMLKGKTNSVDDEVLLTVATIAIPKGQDGKATSENFTWAAGADIATLGYTTATLGELFQTIPSCGDDSGVITIYAYAAGIGESYQIFPECSLDEEKGHVVEGVVTPTVS